LIPTQLLGPLLRAAFEQVDGLVLSGGGDIDPNNDGAPPAGRLRSVDAERDSMEIALACWAAEEGKPLLGICRGLQVLNVTLGGTLHQDLATEVPGALQPDQPDTLAGAGWNRRRD
jgi:putative glutamine amidotransferase